MLRKLVSGIMLMMLLAGMLMLVFDVQPAKAKTLVVPDDYAHIQEAINAASDEILFKYLRAHIKRVFTSTRP